MKVFGELLNTRPDNRGRILTIQELDKLAETGCPIPLTIALNWEIPPLGKVTRLWREGEALMFTAELEEDMGPESLRWSIPTAEFSQDTLKLIKVSLIGREYAPVKGTWLRQAPESLDR